MDRQQMDSEVTIAPPAVPGKRVAVTALGLITLLVGGAYAALAGQFIWAGVSWVERAGADPWGLLTTTFGLGPMLFIAVGVALVPLGLLGLLGGAGTLLRRPGSRTRTFILAVLALLLGLVWVSGAELDATALAFGAAQVLYGILALGILMWNGAASSPDGPRVGHDHPSPPRPVPSRSSC